MIKKEDVRNRLDDLFEVALVLAGVLGASLFQYITSLPVLENSFIQEFMWNFSLGFTIFPFVILIFIWIIKEIYLIKGKALLALRLTFLCWSIWGSVLFIYLTSVFDLMEASEFFMAVSFILGIIPVILVAYGYKFAAIEMDEITYFSNNRWKKELIVFVAFSLVVMVSFLYGFVYSLLL